MEDGYSGTIYDPFADEETRFSEPLVEPLDGRRLVRLDDDEPPTTPSTSQGPSQVVGTPRIRSEIFARDEGFLTTPPPDSFHEPNEHHKEQLDQQLLDKLDEFLRKKLDPTQDRQQRNFIQKNHSGQPAPEKWQSQEQNIPGGEFGFNQSNSFTYHSTPPNQQVQHFTPPVSEFSLVGNSAFQNVLGQSQDEHHFHEGHLLTSLNPGNAHYDDPVTYLSQPTQSYPTHVSVGSFGFNLNPLHAHQQGSFTEPERFRQPTTGFQAHPTNTIAEHLRTDLTYNQGTNPRETNYQNSSRFHNLNPEEIPTTSNQDVIDQLAPIPEQHVEEETSEHVQEIPTTFNQDVADQIAPVPEQHVEEEASEHVQEIPTTFNQDVIDQLAPIPEQHVEEEASERVQEIPTTSNQDVADQIAPIPEQQVEEEASERVQEIPTTSNQDVADQIAPVPEQQVEEEASEHVQEIPTTFNQDVIDQLAPIPEQHVEEEASEHVQEIPTTFNRDVADQIAPVPEQHVEEEASERVQEIPTTSNQDVIDQIAPVPEQQVEEEASEHVQEIPTTSNQDVIDQLAPIPEQHVEEEASERVHEIPITSNQDVADQIAPVPEQHVEEEASEHVQEIPTTFNRDVADQIAPVPEQHVEEEASERVQEIPTTSNQDVIDQIAPVPEQHVEEEASERVQEIPITSNQDVADQIAPVPEQHVEEEASEHVQEIPTTSNQDVIDQIAPVSEQQVEEEASEHVQEIPTTFNQDVIDQLAPIPEQHVEEEASEHVQEIPTTFNRDVADQIAPVPEQHVEEEASERVQEIPTTSNQDVIDQIAPVPEQQVEEEASEHVQEIPTTFNQDVIDQLAPIPEQHVEEEASEHVQEIPTTFNQDVIDQLAPIPEQHVEEEASEHVQEIPTTSNQDVADQIAPVPEQHVEEETSEHVQEIPTISNQDVIDQLAPVLEQHVEEETSEHVQEIPTISNQDVIDQLAPIPEQHVEEETSEHVQEIPTISNQDVIDQLAPVLEQHVEEETSEHVQEIPTTSNQDVIDQLAPVPEKRTEQEKLDDDELVLFSSDESQGEELGSNLDRSPNEGDENQEFEEEPLEPIEAVEINSDESDESDNNEEELAVEVPEPIGVVDRNSDESDGAASEQDSHHSSDGSDNEEPFEEAPIEVIDLSSDGDDDEEVLEEVHRASIEVIIISSDESDGGGMAPNSNHSSDDEDDQEALEEVQRAPTEVIIISSDEGTGGESGSGSDHSVDESDNEEEQLELIETVDIDSDEENDRISELDLDRVSPTVIADHEIEKELHENFPSDESNFGDSEQESDLERVSEFSWNWWDIRNPVPSLPPRSIDFDRHRQHLTGISTYISNLYDSDSNVEHGGYGLSPSLRRMRMNDEERMEEEEEEEEDDEEEEEEEDGEEEDEEEEEERYFRIAGVAEVGFYPDEVLLASTSETRYRKRVHHLIDEGEEEHHPYSPRRISESFNYGADLVDATDTRQSDEEIEIVGTKKRIISEDNAFDLSSQHRRSPSVQEVAVVRSKKQQHTRPDVAPPVEKYQEKASYANEYLNPSKNYKTRKMVEIVNDDVRAVIYRIRNICSEKFRAQHAKRTRVTRQLAHHSILQFHEENEETTEFRYVRETDVIETVDSYLKEAQKLIQQSSNSYDQMIPAALEYDDSIKVLNCGLSMKKLSCKQNRMKFQLSWWEREQRLFQKNRSGFFNEPSEPSYSINEDKFLYRAHFMMQGDDASQLEKISGPLINRLTKRRADNDVILDSSYFVREFFMTKSTISFRIERSSDIPELFVPPTLEAGYFPYSAQRIGDQMHYLASRYKEAQMEYLSLTYSDITPPKGYRTASVTCNELYDFHCMGKHIHGFFVCWESIDKKHAGRNSRGTPKRYLVDMFFKIPFPLYVDYERWDTRLKLAFDRVTIYLLHLSEVCRMNRPVFNKLAQDVESFHQKITFEEIVNLLKERKIDIASFVNYCGKHQFYSFGLSAANESYLSAFMIITGGTKVMKPSNTYNLGNTTVFNSTDQGIWLLNENGIMEYYEDLDGVRPTGIVVQTNMDLGESVEQAVVTRPMPKKHKRTSRLIRDLDLNDEEHAEVPKKRTVYHDKEEQSRPTRKDLINIRRQIYNLPPPPKRKRRRSKEPPKKKPGRKPETLQARGLKEHDFETAYLPSDAESDYEGYLSESEDRTEKVPKLTRSQSSDSIFLDMTYKDYRFNRISYFHRCCIHRPKHPTAKLKKRKMNRISQKHSLRYAMLQKDYSAHKEMLECYHGNLPRLANEIARTKNCIRNPHKHKKLNVPKVFTYGDAPLVDVCAQVLKDSVAHIVALENSCIRAGNTVTRALQEARVNRRRQLETVPKKVNPKLPSFDYLAMEFFFLRQVKSRHSMTLCVESLKAFTQRCTYFAVVQPKYLLMIHMRMQFVEREEYEFEEFLKTQRKLKRHLDRELKEILIENRSYQAETKKDHERRLARRAHAEKVAARKKLTPEERALFDEEDKKNKEKIAREKARMKAIDKETKEAKKRLITNRLNREATAREENNAMEELLRSRHRSRIRKMKAVATLEKRNLQKEHQKLQEIRKDQLKKREKERKEEEKKKLEMRAKLAEKRKKEREAEERKLQNEKEKKEKEAEKKRLEAAERKRIEDERRRIELEKKKALEEKKREELKKQVEKAEEAAYRALLIKREKILEAERRKELDAQLRKLREWRKKDAQRKLDEKSEKKKEEEKKLKINEKKIRDYKEKMRKEAEEKLAKELEEERVKNLEKKMVQELKAKREQETEEAIRNYRARAIVAAFTKEVHQYIEKNRDITLFMCSEDGEDKYKAAREDFKTAKPEELLEKVVPQFVAAYKALSDWNKIRKYIINFPNPATATTCDIPEGFEQLAKNIVAGYKYKKGENKERKWVFSGTMETLFHDVELDLRTRFIEKITELCAPLVLVQNLLSAHPNNTIPFLHSYFVHSVFRPYPENSIENNDTSVQPAALQSMENHRKSMTCRKIRDLSKKNNLGNIVFSKPPQLPNLSCSPFWKLVNLWLLRKKDNNEEDTMEKEIHAYVTRDSGISSGILKWIFPVLGACYTLIVKNPKVRGTAERILLERKVEYLPDSDNCLAAISEELLDLCSYFQEAICSKSNLEAMLKHNGYYLAVRIFFNLIPLIFQLLTASNLPKFMKLETTIDDALTFLFKEIENDFKRAMIERWRYKEDEVSKMKSFVDETIFFIQANTNGSQFSSNVEADEKIKIMALWVHYIKMHFGSRIQETIQTSLLKASHNYHYHFLDHGSDDYDFVRSNESMPRDRSEHPEYDEDSDLEIIQNCQGNINGIGRKRSRHTHYVNKRPRMDTKKDTNFPTRLPLYDDPFIQRLFRTIEISFHNLNLSEREMLEKRLHRKFDENHLEESLYRFHMMERMSDKEYEETSHRILRNDRYNWSQYKRIHLQFLSNLNDIRGSENIFLEFFEHIVVTGRDFRRLKWEVPRKNGSPIKPIEFFSDLERYRSRELYDKNVVNNSIAFSYRVYHHIWFMGVLAPRTYSVDSHETVPDGWCGGCTYGDVIIIPKCTCENHRSAQTGNFCYAKTKFFFTDANFDINRLLGRFVCEHGPSSCLVLETPQQNKNNEVGDQATQVDRSWKPFASRYTSFKSSLKVANIDATFNNIVSAVPSNPDDLETTVNDGDSFWASFAPYLMGLRKPRSQVRIAKPKLRSRTRSEEAPIRRKLGDIRYFNRVVSCMDLTEINKYVAKKFDYARRTIPPERKPIQSENDIPPPFDVKEVTSLERLLSETSPWSDCEKFDMLSAMLECGIHTQNKEDRSMRGQYFSMIEYYYTEQYGLLHVAGEPINDKKNETSPPEEMAPMPIVAELHKEFLDSKEKWMEEARKSMMTVKDIENKVIYEPFKKLTKCYIEIFRFNLYLFRLYLDTVEFRIFNCYAVYEAEKNRDVTFIKKRLEMIENTIDSVSSAFFNERPLIRQLDELSRIKDKHTRLEMNCYVASLCRFAINRIRVPGIADKWLNLSSWVNFTRKHDNALTVAQLMLEGTFPPEFDEEQYLYKLYRRGFKEEVFKRMMNSFYGPKISVAHTVLLALHYQIYDFYEVIRLLMPTFMIDPIMRVYYGQQAFENVINLLYRKTHYLTNRNCRRIGSVHTSVLMSAIVEQGKQRRNLALRTHLDDFFVEMCRYKAVGLPLNPSTIGVSFVCFEKQLMISVVQECRILLDTAGECLTRNHLHLPEYQEMYTVSDSENVFHVIIDKQKEELSICFPMEKGNYKTDQCIVKSRLNKKLLIPETKWEEICQRYFNKKINFLNNFLNTQPFSDEQTDMLPIGRLERPTERFAYLRREMSDFEVTLEVRQLNTAN